MAAPAAGGTASIATEPDTVAIEMEKPLDGRIGVAIQSGRRIVSRLSHKDASSVGWRVGDVIVEVNGAVVDDNEAVKAAVKLALAEHADRGTSLRFVVKRKAKPLDTTQSMLRMTPGTGGGLTVPMVELTRTLTLDFPVVIFLDGTLKVPGNNLSARAAAALVATGLAFKAIDCGDEKYNPGVRAAVEELVGDYALPQLFAGGRMIGNGYVVEELQKSGELRDRLLELGAVPAEIPSLPTAPTAVETNPE